MIEPVAILVGALGGQGGGVLAQWLVDAATRAGHVAQSTSIPGVAQRTGATTYYVELYPVHRAALGARMPVLGLYPVPGRVDLVVASELLEAGRLVAAGYVSADRTFLIASTSRTLTTAEKMPLGDGRFDADRLLAIAREHSRRRCTFDMDAAARETGTMVSAVMLGAIAASGTLPIERAVFEDVVRDAGVGVDASLRGFARGFAAVARPATGIGSAPAARTRADATATAQAVSMSTQFPEPARELVAHGYDRVVEFQDSRYGELYAERLRRIDRAERKADPAGTHECAVLRETARFLALWMAFDDVVRVAALKSRATRYARVRREIGAGPDDVIRIVDHFKPGVPEAAGLLPAPLAQRLVGWDRARQMRGHAPLAWALHVRTHTVAGFLLLRTLAALRRLRRYGARHADEQRRIDNWLACIEAASSADWRLANEVALCGRLIKGYGATNERGKAALAHILEHLANDVAQTPQARADAVASARDAALADEAGAALDEVLVRHGAPARPPTVRPVVWMPRKRAAASPARAH
ncbi:MAG TPA: indolepyruvate oxidoreductase subunit beta family protein [Casimicrobiaceae bacterium]